MLSSRKIFLCFFSLLCFLIVSWRNCYSASRPEEMASNEVRVWKAYYKRDVASIKEELRGFLKDQYRFTPNQAQIDLYAEAIMAFAQTKQQASVREYQEAVLPLLMKAFESIKKESDGFFDVKALAHAELAWWVARRQEDFCNPKKVGELIQETYSILYGGDPKHYDRTSFLRATAALYRDLGQDAFQGGIKEEDWKTIEMILIQAYQSLPR